LFFLQEKRKRKKRKENFCRKKNTEKNSRKKFCRKKQERISQENIPQENFSGAIRHGSFTEFPGNNRIRKKIYRPIPNTEQKNNFSEIKIPLRENKNSPYGNFAA